MFAGERLMLNVFNQRPKRGSLWDPTGLGFAPIPPTTKARGFLGVGS